MDETTVKPGGAGLVALLALSAVVGIVVSLAAWAFLEGTFQLQHGIYDDLPAELGFDDGAPTWWPLPVLALSGLIVAFAIYKLPGAGGHNPAAGLAAEATAPRELPGVLLAAIATISLGAVLGPEAPLIALGSGLGILALSLLRRDAPEPVKALIAASGSFAAISFIFGSPLIGAVILIEAAALDRKQMSVVLPVGLLAAGVGSLVSIGMGHWTGLSNSDYALGSLTLPAFERPDVVDIGWTVALAFVVAVVTFGVFRLALLVQSVVVRRPFALIPAAGVVIAGLAIAFEQTTDHTASAVLFSGQDALPGLVEQADTWTIGALALLLLFKSVAWSISLAGFRGGPTFPGLYLGAAAGIMASHLPGMAMAPAVAVGMAAAVAAVLRLPLAAVVLATLLTAGSGPGVEPLIIVGVVVAFVTTLGISRATASDDPAPQTATGY